MKIILVLLTALLLVHTRSFAQYSRYDSALVRTTFARQFDRQIIKSALASNSNSKVKAALLSIAHSADTSFISNIKKLEFKKYGDYISFALGELGPCSASSDFLMKEIRSDQTPELFRRSAIEALSKTGGSAACDFLKRLYSEIAYNLDGISIAVYNYFIRNLISKENAQKIIMKEKALFPGPSRRNFEAAFALYRVGPDKSSETLLLEELKKFISLPEDKGSDQSYIVKTVPYLLGCFRKLKYFPHDINLIRKLVDFNSSSVRIAAAQALCFFHFSSRKELSLYISMLHDKNPNVARSAAAAMKQITVNSGMKSQLKSVLTSTLGSQKLTSNARGELFLTYISLFPVRFDSAIKSFGRVIEPDFLYTAAGNYPDSDATLNFLLKKYKSEGNKGKTAILGELIKFQKSFPGNVPLRRTLLSALDSSSPALISIAADGLDSVFISANKHELISIIAAVFKLHKDDSDFQESFMSLSELAYKIAESYGKQFTEELKSSSSYPIKKFAYERLKLSPSKLVKNTSNFEKFWSRAFEYKEAEIITNKGKFTIEFLPQFAPVTVGSFCYLAQKGILSNNRFHRVVPGFVIQGGDPEETGWGGPGYDIVSEFSPLDYSPGTVGMASAGKDTEGSQWFVTTGDFPHLNGRYTIFAKVVAGMKTVNEIDQNDYVISIKLIR